MEHYDLQLERIPAQRTFLPRSPKRRKHDNYGGHGNDDAQDEQDRSTKEERLHSPNLRLHPCRARVAVHMPDTTLCLPKITCRMRLVGYRTPSGCPQMPYVPVACPASNFPLPFAAMPCSQRACANIDDGAEAKTGLAFRKQNTPAHPFLGGAPGVLRHPVRKFRG